jgi:hypothetical protein
VPPSGELERGTEEGEEEEDGGPAEASFIVKGRRPGKRPAGVTRRRSWVLVAGVEAYEGRRVGCAPGMCTDCGGWEAG